ncbi:putative nuclease HARBI1 isoform 2-T3 [Odontesthes bonariensis]
MRTRHWSSTRAGLCWRGSLGGQTQICPPQDPTLFIHVSGNTITLLEPPVPEDADPDLQASSSPSLGIEDCDIKEEFYRIAGFPNVIGAVDCTHIKIKSLSGGHEGDFVNRKNFHSINVQMVCNADYLISNVVAKWPGSVHDSRVFRNSDLSAPITR